MTQPLERLYSFNYSSLCARKHPLQIDFSRSNNKWFWSWSKVASFLYFSRLFFHTDWTSFCGFPLEWNCQWQDQPVYDSFIEHGTLSRQHCHDIQITISSLAPPGRLMLTLFLAAHNRRAARTAIIIRANHPATEPADGQSPNTFYTLC